MRFSKRASGVLLHPTALPGNTGIGTLGKEADNFISWLKDAGQSYWQICPLTPTGYGDSPYQGFSAFAGNPNLIDLEELITLELLTESDLSNIRKLPETHVDFGNLIPLKNQALHKAWDNFSLKFSSGRRPDNITAEYEVFCKENAFWLDDFCLFMVIKNKQNNLPWNMWEKGLKYRDKDVLGTILREESKELSFHSFVQYLFYRQWKNVKTLANRNGIKIIGDLPIFVAMDSSDCWSHPELFQLDENLQPCCVAGVPPDYFSATGQLWGNPLYNWKRMEENGFSWWMSILEDKLRHYDALRIDHFRGFSAYWSVPFGEETAVNGKWITAPGPKLFKRVREVLGELPIIAEDLGVITEDVVALIEEFGLPGMKVLQFAFSSSEDSEYLPHNYEKNCLVYTGTHDNDTSIGWFSSAEPEEKQKALAYMNLPDNTDAEKVTTTLVRTALASVANLSVIPLQDILGLDSRARFNTPGTTGGNWKWRVDKNMISREKANWLRNLTNLYGRN